MKTTPITLVVADAGPLISMALANQLKLLFTFDKPVYVLDVVKAECLRKSDAPDREILRNWLGSNKSQISIINSPIIKPFNDALRLEETGEQPHATQGLGDAAIAWFVANARQICAPDALSLVLTEDAPFGDTVLARNVHVLSTRPWLKTLENFGLIVSAQDVLKQIELNGRKVSRYNVDRPAIIPTTNPNKSLKSDWKAPLAKKPSGRGGIDD